MQKNAKIIIVSHLGRPKGMKKSEYSLKPVVKYLSQVLNRKIIFVTDDIRENVPQILNNLRDGDIAVLENIRFYKEEELNDEIFSKKLASLADVYVNDAFGTVHRAHASTQGVTKYLPSVCGFLIKREIDVLGQLLSVPKHPFVAILGGAKVSDKIGVICNLLDKVDTLIIAGGMAYTFLNALGYSIGSSILEPDKVVLAKNIIAKAKDLGVRLVLPVDNVVGKEFKSDTEFMIVNSDSIPDGYVGLDIGAKTKTEAEKKVKLGDYAAFDTKFSCFGAKTKEIFVEIIKNAKTIFWNGPVGVFEWANFRRGTLEITKAIANSDAVTVIGGGDSIAAVDLLGFTDKITHISTGGGASLEFLEGKDLPGILSLDEKI